MPYVDRDEDYQEPLAAASAMWTDLYELTMAQALYFEGIHAQWATFHAFVRSMPYHGAYLVSAGQNIVFEWLHKHWRFDERDIRRLSRKNVTDSKTGKMAPLFQPEFLRMLQNSKMELTLDAMPEGEIAFAGEPIYRVSGPLWQCLLVEAAILNTMNSQSNFATYASMLKTLAQGKPVVEFGLRRAQAVGGLSSTRGCYVGGMDASSNCWAETNYGIDTVGTMAHAYVMVHDDELESFRQWAQHNPYLGIFLVDTYNTLDGVKRAVQACREKDVTLSAIRLDSGDLAYLAMESRKLLDTAGFTSARIIASNGLDAEAIESLQNQKAPIDMYAVGTAAATVSDQPALNGVYKIGAVQGVEGKRELLKLSDDAAKWSYPGELDVIRYLKETNGHAMFDGGTILPLSSDSPLAGETLIKPITSVNRKSGKIRVFPSGTKAYCPLVRIFDNGKLVGGIETVHRARARTLERLEMLDPSHKRRLNPHEHVTGIEEGLLRHQKDMAKILFETGSTEKANKQ